MKTMPIPKNLLAAFAFLVVTSCASEPRYVEPDGDAAFLQNRVEYQGQARFAYFFEYADMQKLGPGPWSLKLPATFVNRIRPGTTIVGLKILYTPAYGQNIFTRGNDRQYFIFVRDLGFAADRIRYMSEKIADPAGLSGLRGLSFVAEAGHTYQIACQIDDGLAYVWIEETDGKKVSAVVRGFADAHYVTHTTVEMGLHSGRHGPPDLVGGWKILDDLPSPLQ